MIRTHRAHGTAVRARVAKARDELHGGHVTHHHGGGQHGAGRRVKRRVR